MRKNLLLLSFVSITALGQNIPTVPCSSCGGTGRAGYVACYMCQGSGRMTDPKYANQQAYEYGRRLMDQAVKRNEEAESKNADALIYNGARAVVRGDYRIALSKFEKAMMELGDGSAYFYFGAMHELGMGTSVNRDFAVRCYNAGSRKNDPNCIKALARINDSGHWNATEATRNRFRQILSNMLNQASSIGNAIISQDRFDGNNSSNKQRSICSRCHGTKYDSQAYKYSASADSYHNHLGNSCKYCGKSSDHFHYKCHYCSPDGKE